MKSFYTFHGSYRLLQCSHDFLHTIAQSDHSNRFFLSQTGTGFYSSRHPNLNECGAVQDRVKRRRNSDGSVS